MPNHSISICSFKFNCITYLLNSRLSCLQHIRRLLELVEKYISVIEETHPAPRTILPHGLAFKGEPIGLYVKTEDSKTDIDLVVSAQDDIRAVDG